MTEKYVTNCPLETPFATNLGCIDCLSPKNIFNIETKTCIECPEGSSFDLQNRNCKIEIKNSITTFQTYLNSDRWMLGTKTMPEIIKDYAERSMAEKNVTNCPIDKPFWNGTGCIDCIAP